eukprot:2446748-Prymnesium_polylepis.2
MGRIAVPNACPPLLCPGGSPSLAQCVTDRGTYTGESPESTPDFISPAKRSAHPTNRCPLFHNAHAHPTPPRAASGAAQASSSSLSNSAAFAAAASA